MDHGVPEPEHGAVLAEVPHQAHGSLVTGTAAEQVGRRDHGDIQGRQEKSGLEIDLQRQHRSRRRVQGGLPGFERPRRAAGSLLGAAAHDLEVAGVGRGQHDAPPGRELRREERPIGPGRAALRR